MSDSCNPVDCSPPGSFVLGIFQARILEWAAIASSRGSSCPRDRTVSYLSCIVRWVLYHQHHLGSQPDPNWPYPVSNKRVSFFPEISDQKHKSGRWGMHRGDNINLHSQNQSFFPSTELEPEHGNPFRSEESGVQEDPFTILTVNGQVPKPSTTPAPPVLQHRSPRPLTQSCERAPGQGDPFESRLLSPSSLALQ